VNTFSKVLFLSFEDVLSPRKEEIIKKLEIESDDIYDKMQKLFAFLMEKGGGF
jgi:hypothetical protein